MLISLEMMMMGDIEGSGDANMEDNIRPEINTESIEHFGR
jgi:hypothetical protein